MGDIVFGTSGWDYKEWVGPFYKEERRKFSFYIKFFGTSEINSTFYRYPTRQMVYGLYRYSPKDFKFSVKLPRLITHKKRLSYKAKVESDLIRFLELLNPLKASDKLGAILIQLPPSFTFDGGYDNLQQFFEILPEDYRFAVEFRNWSWMRDDTWELLRRHNVAYTIVDEPLLPPDIHVTADFAYFRWHGRGEKLWYDYHYNEEELRPWVPRVREVASRVRRVYGYFNNHFHGYAVENCVQILEMLGAATPDQITVKERIIKHTLTTRPKAYQRRLEQFDDIAAYRLEELVLELMGPERLARERTMTNEALSFVNVSQRRIEVKIREYTVTIDFDSRTIVHDCRDWSRGFAKKRLCKHLGKVFLELPSEYAVPILRDLVANRKGWRFEMPIEGGTHC